MDIMLPPGRLYHWAYVVDDLESAMDRMGEIFQIEWAPIAQRTMRTRDPERGAVDNDFVITYSVTGPPHVEVIQGVPGTLWDPSAGNHLHHVGLWADGDIGTHAQRLVDLGLPIAGHGIDDDGNLSRFTYHENPYGPWIELVAETTRGPWEEWMAGRPLVIPA